MSVTTIPSVEVERCWCGGTPVCGRLTAMGEVEGRFVDWTEYMVHCPSCGRSRLGATVEAAAAAWDRWVDQYWQSRFMSPAELMRGRVRLPLKGNG